MTRTLAPTADWSVELWFKDQDPNGFDHTYRYLINKGDGLGPESPVYLLIGNGNLLAGLRTGGINHPLTFNLNQPGWRPQYWKHVAATFTAASRTLTLYVDGFPVASQVLSVISTGNNLPLEIGRQGPVAGKNWVGKIDDVRVWNVVRSGPDIAANYLNEPMCTMPKATYSRRRTCPPTA